jgi:hypothetical protein
MSYNTIKINNHSDNFEEYVADAAIYPGMLLELNTDNEVKAHATSGGNIGSLMFALEDAFQGNGIDTAYAAGDRVRVWFPQSGDIVLGILADGQDVAEGTLLESNGAGYLQAITPEEVSASGQDTAFAIYHASVVGISLEEMDASADSSGQDIGVTGLGVNKRIRVRIR